jgi:hypothetical protein
VERSSMRIARFYKQIRALVVGTSLLLSLLLGGCADFHCWFVTDGCAC